MAKNEFLEKLRAGDVLLGLGNMYPAAGIIEGMCAGWDYAWIDAQHGQMSYDSALAAMRAADVIGVSTVLRVPGHESGILGPFADLSPSAIMVPMVNTAQQADAVVRGLRFPPRGERSYGGRRVIDLGGREYYREQELGIIAQIETVEAAQNADSIIRTDGIDLLFFGPDDMKVRLGLPINTKPSENDELAGAMRKTAEAARGAGKFCGCVGADPATARMAVEMGYQMLVAGGDIVFLRTLAAQRLEEIRNAVKGKKTDAASPQSGGGLYGG